MTHYEMIESMPLAKGKNELLSHINGETLTLRQAVMAKCYDCYGYYQDGKVPCTSPICPLFPYMPYNPNKRKSRTMSEDQKKAARERFQNAVISGSGKLNRATSKKKAVRGKKVSVL